MDTKWRVAVGFVDDSFKGIPYAYYAVRYNPKRSVFECDYHGAYILRSVAQESVDEYNEHPRTANKYVRGFSSSITHIRLTKAGDRGKAYPVR